MFSKLKLCLSTCLLFLLSAATVAAEPTAIIDIDMDNPTTSTIRPVWTQTNIWDIGQMPQDRKTTIIREIILMTATGGRPTNNMATILPDGSLKCDFTSLTLALDRALNLKLIPTIVFGNTPDCLSTSTEIREFEVNTLPPTKTELYSQYIEELFKCLAERYGKLRVLSWHYRLMTEPDNSSWWTGNGMKGYCELYDLTVAAARRALPDIVIDGGNYMNCGKLKGTSWVEAWPRWIASNESKTSAALPHKIASISFSGYCHISPKHSASQIGLDSRNLKSIMDTLKTCTEKHISYPLRYYIAEGQQLYDENQKYLWLGDGTEKGAAWNAAMIKQAHDTGLDRNVQWGWGGLADSNLQSPVHHTLQMFEAMLGDHILPLNIQTRNTTDSLYLDAIATTANDGTIRIIAFSYDWAVRDNPEQTPVTINLSTHKDSTKYAVEQWRIDREHSNFMTQWIKDSANLKMVDRGCNSGSHYDLDVRHTLDDEGLKVWNSNIEKYHAMDDLELMEPSQTVETKDGKLSLSLSLPSNSVAQFVIRPLN